MASLNGMTTLACYTKKPLENLSRIQSCVQQSETTGEGDNVVEELAKHQLGLTGSLFQQHKVDHVYQLKLNFITFLMVM